MNDLPFARMQVHSFGLYSHRLHRNGNDWMQWISYVFMNMVEAKIVLSIEFFEGNMILNLWRALRVVVEDGMWDNSFPNS